MRNRSAKEISLNNAIFINEIKGADYSFIGIISKRRYATSAKETMDSLKYTQKVSQNYNVNSTHSVLKSERDEFTTFEDILIDKHKFDSSPSVGMHEILLKPREIGNFKIYARKLPNAVDEKTKALNEHLQNIHEEEIQMEKSMASDNKKKGSFRI